MLLTYHFHNKIIVSFERLIIIVMRDCISVMRRLNYKTKVFPFSIVRTIRSEHLDLFKLEQKMSCI